MGVYAKYLDKAFNSADLNRERKKQLHRIAELRHRHVLVIAADVQNRLAGLSNEDLLAIRDQLSNVDGGDAIDLILETPGGSGEAAEDIVRLIRGQFSSMGVIVPGTAKSAGTILAMAGDEILMSDESGLGPIDAQITQKGKVFSAHALLQGMNQIKQEIKETGNLNRVYIPMLQNLSPGELQHARNVQDFAVELVRKWLVNYKFKDWTMHRTSGEAVTEEEKQSRADEIANALSNHSRWKTHGRSIKISDLHKLGLRITDFGDNHKLADAIRRYYILLRMTFESNIFKLFETPTSQIIRFEHVNVMGPPVPTPVQDKANQAIVGLTCKKCNTVMKIQGNLGVQSPLLPGHLPFPANNKLQCPTCGVAHDLIQARQQVEAQSKKPLLTPPR